ncbi:MAG: hypothetical protein WCY08_16685 [Rhodocyclaceae bacterium]
MKDKSHSKTHCHVQSQAGKSTVPGQAATAPHAPGTAGDGEPGLRLPHERDQGTDATSSTPDPVIKQAHDDLKSGQVDTDLRGIAGLDAKQRRRLVRRAP